ncbi:acyltransferase family protein [Hafnia alvei]|uniref:acyltransferase family protein n=1 Tax=Hafnia alvei TaxID=569 RepID=UPI004044EFA0
MKDKLLYIEGIRGIACLMVVLSHLALVFYPGLHEQELIKNSIERSIFNSPLPFFYSGTAAVFIFFVLSGYVLTYGVMKNKDILSSISSMTIRRYFRLAPPVLASCILSYFVISLFTPDTSLLSQWISGYGKFDSSISGAIYSGLIETFFRGGSSYNPVLWTMKIELIGSFIIFFYCAVAAKVERRKILAISFAIVIILLPLSQTEKYSYICFMTGAIFNFIKIKLKSPSAIILLCIGIYFGGVHYGSTAYSSAINLVSYSFFGEMTNAYYLFCATSGLFIVFSIIFNEKLSAFFSIRPIVYTGRVSFSVYLIHMPIIYLLSPFFFNITLPLTGYFYASVFSSIITIVCIYVISNTFYKMFDIRSIKLSKIVFNLIK